MLSKERKNLLNYWINPSRIKNTITENHCNKRDLDKNSNTDSTNEVSYGYDRSTVKDSYGLQKAKKLLRSDFIKKRNGLSDADIDRKSKIITEFLLKQEPLNSAQTVGLYYPVNNEVDTRYIFQYLRSRNVETYFPRVSGSELDFYKVNKLSELKPANFNVPQPFTGYERINTNELDLLLIPGVAFDRNGNRLGYGRGYYDRAIDGINRSGLFGLCYHFQIVPELPVEQNDRRVGSIVTEQGLIKCEKERR